MELNFAAQTDRIEYSEGGLWVVWAGCLSAMRASHFVAGCGNNLQNVFDTVINYIYHTVLQEKKHLP